MIYIGIDPAQSGAAVIVDKRNVVACFSWKTRIRNKQKVYELKCSMKNLTTTLIVKAPPFIGKEIANACKGLYDASIPICIACEDAYLGKSPKTSIIVARFSGIIVGATYASLDQYVITSCWAKATTWRKTMLNLNHFSTRVQAKKASIGYIPHLIPSINPHLKAHGLLDHITDACGVALWASSTYKAT